MVQFRSKIWVAAFVGLAGLSMFAISAETADEDKVAPAASNSPRQRPDTPTGRLLDQLEVQNTNENRFRDPWLRTLKQIVDLGSNAVPDLTAELDATGDSMMLRCCGFALRAVGDKRAVPALIRSIPKTLRPPESDYGLSSNDAGLAKWAQQHEHRDSPSEGNAYGFGRPVREIFAALNKLTNHKLNERQLYHVFLDGLESQRRMKRELFHREARQWAEWWDEHAAEFTQDAAYAHVNLPQLTIETPKAPPIDAHYKTGEGHSNWVLESVFDPKSETVFYDLDSSRTAQLPQKWRDMKSPALDEIVAWAEREGFDLMGTQYTAPDGKQYYALRSIALKAWELEPQRWKMQSDDLTIDKLTAEGLPSPGELLLHFDKTSQSFDPKATASFFFITREHTPGLLFIGIEVTDDSLQRGGLSVGDSELSPIAFRKGRRFAYTEFEEVK